MAAIILYLLNGVVVTALYQQWLKRHAGHGKGDPTALSPDPAGVSPDGL